MKHLRIWALLLLLCLLTACGASEAAEQSTEPDETAARTAVTQAADPVPDRTLPTQEQTLPTQDGTLPTRDRTEPAHDIVLPEPQTAEPEQSRPALVEPEPPEPVSTEEPLTEPEPEPETTEPIPPDAGLTGTVMEVTSPLKATPETPEVQITVRFPQVDPTGAEEGRSCTLELRQDGKVLDRIDPFLLTQGAEAAFPLTYEFTRYMDVSPQAYTVVLQYRGEYRVATALVELENDPDEVYAKKTGDSRPYMIEVVRNHNVVIVYGRDDAGDYTMPVQVYVCSTGRGTPSGTYSLGEKYEWGWLFGGVAGQYVSRITGNILFHSVPYYTKAKDRLETEEYNKLGTAASMGCVRLPVRDAKWIYENCPQGTKVRIYDTETLTVEKPKPIHIDPADPRAGWDPTDPDEDNPWLKP